jgi:hypothetical protein
VVTDSVVEGERSQCVWAGVAEEVPPASRDDWVWTGPLLASFVALAFTTRPPRTTWFQPGLSSSCSGETLAGADYQKWCNTGTSTKCN